MRKLVLLLPAWMPSWAFLPALDTDYRRLLLWSYGLGIRVQVMSWVVAVVGPFATRRLVTLLNQRSRALSAEIAALKQAVRERRCRRMVPVLPPLRCQNPWV